VTDPFARLSHASLQIPAFAFVLAVLGVILASGCGSLEKVGHTDLAWKTYTDPTYGYEISYPRDWEAKQRDPERVEDFDRYVVDIKGETSRKYDGTKVDELLSIEADAAGSWCSDAASRQTTELTIDGHAGVRTLCFREEESCEPEPNCWALPYGVILHFDATDELPSLTFVSEPTTDSFLMRRMLDTLRFPGPPDLKATR